MPAAFVRCRNRHGALFMPGTITPLPIMLEEEDRKTYEKLEPPKTIVCRYGYQKLVAELPYDGDAKPGCGTKLVIRTGRGIELAEMLTTTCPNAGCSKSVTRKDMLGFIENSGGKDYPFTTEGRILRLASVEDVRDQEHIDERKPEIIQFAKSLIRELDVAMRLVEVELLLGGERILFYYTAEKWVDFRDLVRRLASQYQTPIDMQQVNAREEARLLADYERCGQYCCCKNFLKVLKPVSMRSAKVQKATLDPTKISGRCGRLMCCLRYEDQTYEELRKRLPPRQSRVQTEDGLGTIIDTQILTQLVLVRVDDAVKPQAYPLENIRKLNKEEEAQIKAEAEAAADRSSQPPQARRPSRPPKAPAPPAAKDRPQPPAAASHRVDGPQTTPPQAEASQSDEAAKAQGEGAKRRGKRRRRRNRRGKKGEQGGPPAA